MESPIRYVIVVLDPLTQEVQKLRIEAFSAFDACQQAKQLHKHHLITRVSYE